MDELSEAIINTKQRIIDALNESGLHPMILQMMMNDIQRQVNDAVLSIQQKGEEKDGGSV